MKLIALTLTIFLTTSLFAQSPATEAVNRLFSNGSYEGRYNSEKCTVTIESTNNSVTISISNNAFNDSIILVNGSSDYKVSNDTGAIAATQKLNYPRYIKGGTKILNVVPDDIDQVEFSLTQLLEDHQGLDFSTYASCILAK